MYPPICTTYRQQQQATRYPSSTRTREPSFTTMMVSKKLLAVLALASALILDHARAVCICTRIYFSLCQRYDMSDVVIHATVSAR